ncbi:unnamed protein product, partial [Trichogramma brassicae]
MPDFNDTALETQLRRFLYLGKEGPEYQPGNWFVHNYFVAENLPSVYELAENPLKHDVVISLILEKKKSEKTRSRNRDFTIAPSRCWPAQPLSFCLSRSSAGSLGVPLRSRALPVPRSGRGRVDPAQSCRYEKSYRNSRSTDFASLQRKLCDSLENEIWNQTSLCHARELLKFKNDCEAVLKVYRELYGDTARRAKQAQITHFFQKNINQQLNDIIWPEQNLNGQNDNYESFANSTDSGFEPKQVAHQLRILVVNVTVSLCVLTARRSTSYLRELVTRARRRKKCQFGKRPANTVTRPWPRRCRPRHRLNMGNIILWGLTLLRGAGEELVFNVLEFTARYARCMQTTVSCLRCRSRSVSGRW